MALSLRLTLENGVDMSVDTARKVRAPLLGSARVGFDDDRLRVGLAVYGKTHSVLAGLQASGAATSTTSSATTTAATTSAATTSAACVCGSRCVGSGSRRACIGRCRSGGAATATSTTAATSRWRAESKTMHSRSG